MTKIKANPLQKMAKKRPVFDNFFTPKNVSKWLKMKGNGLKRRFLLI